MKRLIGPLVMLISILFVIWVMAYPATVSVTVDGQAYTCTPGGTPPVCPPGQHWNGSACVPDTQSGAWTSQVASAIKLSSCNSQTQLYGRDTQTSGFSLNAGQVQYVLISPKEFGVAFPGCYDAKGAKWCPYINYQAIDPIQGQGMKVRVMIYKLDSANNEMGRFEVTYSGDVSSNNQANLTGDEYAAGVKFLVEHSCTYGSGGYSRVGWKF